MADSSSRRRTSVGVLFWIAFILLVLVIFLANRSNIENVLETTGIVDVIRDRVGRDHTNTSPPAELPSPTATDTRTVDTTDGTSPGTPVATPAPQTPRITMEPEQPVTAEQPAEPAAEPVAEPVAEPRTQTRPTTTEPAQDVSKPNRRMAALYFIRVTDDGRTYPQRVVRPVDYDDSPLTETIRALIAGPSGDELTEGLLNLIPANTQLISAHVDGGVAYLNFNRAFRFNPMGTEGTVAQLQQIIYSSTEFPTVTKVQFLIEGERVDYVGGDGIYIGAPLGRDAFSS